MASGSFFLYSVSEQHVMLELPGLQDVLGSRQADWARTFLQSISLVTFWVPSTKTGLFQLFIHFNKLYFP